MFLGMHAERLTYTMYVAVVTETLDPKISDPGDHIVGRVQGYEGKHYYTCIRLHYLV